MVLKENGWKKFHFLENYQLFMKNNKNVDK